ncbi:MAG: hypothetical protein IT490_03580 [Candidatus Contendobacter sp.]|nr:hypothetical protein [Candidatus Contendobacter sp.]
MDNDSTGKPARLSPDEAAQRENDRIKWRAAAEAQAQQLVDSNNAVERWWASLPAGRGPVIGGEPTGLLSLAERADRGLLADNPDWLPSQDELPLDDVLWLEGPTNTGGRAAHIRTAIDLGLLVTDPDKPGVIQRDRYRQWRAQCPTSLFPESSSITAWIGELPSVFVREPLPEPVADGGAAEKEAALLALLDEVDQRAAAQGAGFNRHSLPGTKAEFHELLKAYCPAFKYIQLGKYTNGKCKFQHGVQPKHGKGAAIWALFPEYHLKLG